MRALHDVTLACAAREFCAFVGPADAESTLLNLIGGWINPTSGTSRLTVSR